MPTTPLLAHWPDLITLADERTRLSTLHGCEADTQPDGQLEFPDKALHRFDIVVT